MLGLRPEDPMQHPLRSEPKPRLVVSAQPVWLTARAAFMTALAIGASGCLVDDGSDGPAYTPRCGNAICEAGESGVCTDCDGGDGGTPDAECGNDR